MTITASHDRLDDELGQLRRQRTEQQRETRSLRLEVAHDAPGAATRLAESINREDELQSAIAELEAQKQARLSAHSNGNGYRGEGILSDPPTVEALRRAGSSSYPVGNLDLGPMCSRDELVQRINSGNFGVPRLAAPGPVTVPTSAPARQGTFYGTVPALQPALTLSAFIPTVTTDGAVVPYLQQQPGGYHAAEVAEMQLKPEGELGLVDAEAKVQTIAVWVKTPRQALSDVPQLQTTIQGQLIYDVRHRLEGQLISGDGQGNNLLGILNTSGVNSVPNAAGPTSDLVLAGITAVTMSNAIPDAVVVNPVDLAAMLSATADGSGQRLESPGAFGAVRRRLTTSSRVYACCQR